MASRYYRRNFTARSDTLYNINNKNRAQISNDGRLESVSSDLLYSEALSAIGLWAETADSEKLILHRGVILMRDYPTITLVDFDTLIHMTFDQENFDEIRFIECTTAGNSLEISYEKDHQFIAMHKDGIEVFRYSNRSVNINSPIEGGVYIDMNDFKPPPQFSMMEELPVTSANPFIVRFNETLRRPMFRKCLTEIIKLVTPPVSVQADEKTDPNRKCIICTENIADYIMLDCMHMVCCPGCHHKMTTTNDKFLTTCPKCRQPGTLHLVK